MRTLAASGFAVALLCLFAPAAHADDAAVPPVPPTAPVSPEHGVSIHVGDSDEDPAAVISNLPPDVRSRLTGDQVGDIMRRSQETHTESAAAVVVPAIFFFTVLGIVAAVLLGRHRREVLLHETLQAMIEKGADIPKELLVGNKPKPNDRRRGLILVGTGLGLMTCLRFVDTDNDHIWAFGLVPLLVGAGYLVAFFVERRDATPPM